MFNDDNERMREKSLRQINMEDEDIIQDNSDLLELERRYEKLDIPYKDRRIIDDYIACIVSRGERMEKLVYYAGIRDAENIK